MDADFLKRLGYFLGGLSLGIIFLTFFFKKKTQETGVEFCYLPNCRVLKDIRSKSLNYSDAINQMIANKQVDSAEVNQFFFDGDIDFSQSDTESLPCRTYVIEGTVNEKPAVVTVKNCTEKMMVETLTL